jgi:hypothetical protein
MIRKNDASVKFFVTHASIFYLKGCADGREAKAGIAKQLAFNNHRRPHRALANRTPMAV